eukprot:s57_g3.t1
MYSEDLAAHLRSSKGVPRCNRTCAHIFSRPSRLWLGKTRSEPSLTTSDPSISAALSRKPAAFLQGQDL